jgi:hypothetical protein
MKVKRHEPGGRDDSGGAGRLEEADDGGGRIIWAVCVGSVPISYSVDPRPLLVRKVHLNSQDGGKPPGRSLASTGSQG